MTVCMGTGISVYCV